MKGGYVNAGFTSVGEIEFGKWYFFSMLSVALPPVACPG